MKNRAKKRWFALIILLLCAVVIGLFYWNGQKKMQSDEGYLVKYSLLFTPVSITPLIDTEDARFDLNASRPIAKGDLKWRDALLVAHRVNSNNKRKERKTGMKDLTLSQQYALLALDGQESIHSSVAKSAVLRAVSAARVLETELGKADADSFSEFSAELQKAVQMAKTLKKKEETQIEKEVAAVLEAEELLKEVPDILGCDMNYDTSGVELKAYLSDETSYIRIKEGLRAEILEDGPISLEDAVLLWLLRESGCIHDLFSVSEQNRVEERMTEAAVQDEKYRALWEAEFHNVFEGFMNRFVKTKSKLLKNPYLEGVNLVFPYLDRRKSVFIDMVIFGTNVADRRVAAVEYLKKKGFAVEEIRVGSETLLKIGNIYYRIFPMTKTAYKVPIQGVNLVPAYWQ